MVEVAGGNVDAHVTRRVVGRTVQGGTVSGGNVDCDVVVLALIGIGGRIGSAKDPIGIGAGDRGFVVLLVHVAGSHVQPCVAFRVVERPVDICGVFGALVEHEVVVVVLLVIQRRRRSCEEPRVLMRVLRFLLMMAAAVVVVIAPPFIRLYSYSHDRCYGENQRLDSH
ncbi:hypothetical protein D3C76_1260380 [compost metagenome]